AALAAVSAAYDEEMGALLRHMLKDEPADGPFNDLVTRLISLAS
ncbi:MAG: TetR family transcriptional regulator, partial [Streptomyces sp.]|nr:TetR family transcriptional regulator [Streptomyces sp.]